MSGSLNSCLSDSRKSFTSTPPWIFQQDVKIRSRSLFDIFRKFIIAFNCTMQNRIFMRRKWPPATHRAELLPSPVALDFHFVNSGGYWSRGNKAWDQIRPPTLQIVDFGLECRNLLFWPLLGDQPIVDDIPTPSVDKKPNLPLVKHYHASVICSSLISITRML